MSAYAPPTYSVTPFNPAYFATPVGDLTLADASGLFLNKTTPDTATALETFTGGILTNSISPTTTASTISLISSKTGSTNADPAIAIATSDLTRTIKLGNESATNQNSVHLAGLDITYHGLNAITGTTGVIQIGNKQTTLAGILNLGCSTAGNIRVDAPINIGTDTTMTGIITIGSTNTTQSTIIKNADVRMGTTKNITLKTDGTAPADGTKLGGTVSGTINTFGTSGYTSATLTIVTPGVYLFTFAIQLTGSGINTICFSRLSGAGVKSTDYGSATVNTTNTTSVGTQIVTATATAYNVTSTFSATVTGRDATNSYFTATRIA
jgi:hypothetical protein